MGLENVSLYSTSYLINSLIGLLKVESKSKKEGKKQK